jgi:hypothetical protein
MGTALVVIIVVALVALVLYVGLRHQRSRAAAGGVEPEPVEPAGPAPDRRRPPGSV